MERQSMTEPLESMGREQKAVAVRMFYGSDPVAAVYLLPIVGGVWVRTLTNSRRKPWLFLRSVV